MNINGLNSPIKRQTESDLEVKDLEVKDWSAIKSYMMEVYKSEKGATVAYLSSMIFIMKSP